MLGNHKRVFYFAIAAAAFFAFAYGVVAYRYWHDLPQIKRNYAAELNAPLLAVPEIQRAWPIYRAAVLELARDRPTLWIEDSSNDARAIQDPTVATYLLRIEPQLRRVREATKLPALGCLLADQPLAEDREVANRHRSESKEPQEPEPPLAPASENPCLAISGVDSLGAVQELARCLAAHAILSAKRGDPQLAAADITALMRLARQIREMPLLINGLFAFGTLRVGLNTWAAAMHTDPNLFTNEQLVRLEQEARNALDGNISLSLTGCRYELDDLVQRCYSDDGHGDGHAFLPAMAAIGRGPEQGFWEKAYAPISPPSRWSRKRLTDAADRLFALLEQQKNRPYWDHRIDELYDEAERLEDIPEMKLLTASTICFSPKIANEPAENLKQVRDVVVLASAMTRFHRDRNRWPESLELLVPDYIAEIPLDRICGQPVRYALLGPQRHQPRIYSVGWDRDDDGGRAVRVRDYEADDDRMIDWHVDFSRGESNSDGDMILWPLAPPPADNSVDPAHEETPESPQAEDAR